MVMRICGRRRLSVSLVAVGGALFLGGCLAVNPTNRVEPVAPVLVTDSALTAMYGPIQDGKFLIPAVDIERTDRKFLRQQVAVPDGIPSEPGTVVVDPGNRFLYLILPSGQALRYGVGVGRQGFAWSGTAEIHHAGAWPKWFPPTEMIKRDPKTAAFANGMPGGLDNPLGARALYLFQNERDTLYRIHGTNDPSSIGKAVSSGCIRLFNQDIIDLYNRVPEGTKVIVLPTGQGSKSS